MCKNGLLKPYMCGLHSAEMTLKFHSYCCVNAKYHLKNALKNNKKAQQSDPSCGYSGTFYTSQIQITGNDCLWLLQLLKPWKKCPPSFYKKRCSYCFPAWRKNCICSNLFNVRILGDVFRISPTFHFSRVWQSLNHQGSSSLWNGEAVW